jgi:hypothetical protein
MATFLIFTHCQFLDQDADALASTGHELTQTHSDLWGKREEAAGVWTHGRQSTDSEAESRPSQNLSRRSMKMQSASLSLPGTHSAKRHEGRQC